MEKNFDSSWGSNKSLNKYFYEYEKQVLTGHIQVLEQYREEAIERGRLNSMDIPDIGLAKQDDTDQFILFENDKKRHLKDRLDNLKEEMENPYQILRRFIKWEMLDLEAMIETIESKNEIIRRRDKLKSSILKDTQEIKKLQNGSRFFMSHSYKVNRITVLNDRIELTEREIDCAEVLMKIIYLYQQDVAIPFFRMDKLGVYNGAINLYGLK